MGLRFLHLADCHLETSFGGRPETRERLRRATREAFERALDYAIEERLHAVLIAGDLYDDRLLSNRTELWLVRRIRSLAEAGVWLLVACGNHDPGGPEYHAAKLGLEAGPEAWRSRVHWFRDPTPEAVTVTDPQGRPLGIVVGAGHASERESENLAARFGPAEGSLPVVGLLHTQVEAAPGADRHERYAPSGHADYRRLDYSYFALGHIHQRQRVAGDLPVYYAGNLQGRHSRETGEKGGLVVEAHARAPAEPRFVRFGPLRWARLRVENLPAEGSLSALADHLGGRIAAERRDDFEELAICLELAGATPHARTLRSPEERAALEDDLAAACGVAEVQLRDVGVRLPSDRSALREVPTVLAEALGLIERLHREDALLLELAPEPLARDPHDEASRLRYVRELLDDLPEELVERCLPEGSP
jgi:DNA repair exonuclease SbcCD nuclease subunit